MKLSNKTLHKNYLMLTRFVHPDCPIKRWVEEDEDQVGAFHNDILWLWPVIERIESLGNKVAITTDFTEITMYNSLGALAGKIMIKVKPKEEHGKMMSVYRACVAGVKWLNDMQKSDARI